MVHIINAKTTRDRFKALLDKLRRDRRRHAGVDVKSFAGKITIKEDPVQVQRRLRDAWDQATVRA